MTIGLVYIMLKLNNTFYTPYSLVALLIYLPPVNLAVYKNVYYNWHYKCVFAKVILTAWKA